MSVSSLCRSDAGDPGFEYSSRRLLILLLTSHIFICRGILRHSLAIDERRGEEERVCRRGSAHASEDTKQSRLPRWMCARSQDLKGKKEDVQQGDDYFVRKVRWREHLLKQPYVDLSSSNSEQQRNGLPIQ